MMERSTSLLPTIKCSTCSRNVPIQELPSHLCYDTFKLPKPNTPLTLDTSSLFINKSINELPSNHVLPSTTSLSTSASASTTTLSSSSSLSFLLNKLNRKRSNSNTNCHSDESWKIPKNNNNKHPNNSKYTMVPMGKGIYKSSSTDSSLSSLFHKFQRQSHHPNKSSHLNEQVIHHNEEDQEDGKLYRTYSNDSISSCVSPMTPPDHRHHYKKSSGIPFRTFTIYHPAPLDYQLKEENENEPPPLPPSSSYHDHDHAATTKFLSSYYHQYFLNHQQQLTKINCFGCKRPIQDLTLSIQFDHHHSYHQHCLKCHLCRISLKNKDYKVHQGQVYCLQDYQEYIQSKPNCATCNESIEPHQRPTKAFGHYYHSEHLTCAHCSKPIDETTTGIVRHKSKLYCRTDYNHLFLPTCQGCQKPIERETVTSSDGKLKGKWHKHCFHCYQCQQPFPNHQFYVFNNRPYCQQHYHQLNHSLCHACQLPIEGRCAQISLNNHHHFKYHPQCFICYICQEQVKDIYFTDKFHHIYCSTHGQQKETIISDLSML